MFNVALGVFFCNMAVIVVRPSVRRRDRHRALKRLKREYLRPVFCRREHRLSSLVRRIGITVVDHRLLRHD